MAIEVHRVSSAHGGDIASSHIYLMVKFRILAEPTACTKSLQDECMDRGGLELDRLHNGAQAKRPPRVNRCGAALAPIYKELEEAPVVGEALEQMLKDKATPAATVYYAVAEAMATVRELATAECEDDGAWVWAKAVRFFGEGGHEGRQSPHPQALLA